MNITLITIGAPQLSFAKEAIAEYTKRLQRFVSFNIVHVKEGKKTSSKILQLCEKTYCIALDEKGKHFSSHSLAEFLEKKKNQSQNLSFIIGGPDGHNPEIYERADLLWSLSNLTFPHDIAMMLTVETLYRSSSMNVGHPYHRD